jgi:NAD(P)H-nitrite reductase large subunit
MSRAYDYVIVGGGIAGVTAAETIRAHDHEGSIAIFSAEPHPLYSRVMLPLYVRGKLRREQVFLRTPADYEKNNISIFYDQEVIGINLDRREIHTNIGSAVVYRALLISAGGVPKPWAIKGGDHPLVYRLQTIEDADRLREILQSLNAKPEALIIGCGFIGLEFIESCVVYGIKPLIIMPDQYALKQFLGPDGARLLEEQWQRENGEIKRATSVEAIQFSEQGVVALAAEGQGYRGAFAAVGIGLTRAIQTFTGIGLEVNQGIKTNEFLETNQHGVFAAGDVAEYYDVIFQTHRLVGNWTNAYLQGSIAGENMAHFVKGEQDAYRPFRKVSSYSLTHMGMHLAFMGECDPAAAGQIKEEYSPQERAYIRTLWRNERMIGASLINRPKEIPRITKMIEEGKI